MFRGGAHSILTNQILGAAGRNLCSQTHLISIAGRSITITSHDMLMAWVSVATGLLFGR